MDLLRRSNPIRLAGRSQVALASAIWLLGASAAIVLVAPLPAWAAWTVTSAGNARASTQTVPTASTPTASASGQDVTVSWSPTTLSGGTAASGYVVRRYDASLVLQTVLAGCASVTSSSCVEHGVPAGTWTYSVQARRGAWLGPEGARSAAVVVTAGSFSITAGQKVRAATNVTGGALSGFFSNETVTFRLDSASGTVLNASISSVNGSGAASGFTVTIPAGSGEGSHTIVAVGASGTRATSNSFVFDSVAPTHSISLGTATAAWWSGTTLFFDSGVAGNFRLVDALADATSGPASVTYPSFTATRWTATGGTVSTPSGGPYTSAQYSWTAGPATPANQTIAGTDAAGNTANVTLSFTADNTNPTIANSNLRIAPVGNTTTAGFIGQGRQYYVYANATDAGAGVAAITANVNNITTGQTAVPLVAGSYTVAGVSYGWRSAALTATNPLSAGSKNYTATATDRVGNATTTGNASVTVENTAPTGSVTVPTAGGSVPASATVSSNSTDAGAAGVHSVQLQFSVAGAGSWTTIATDTATPFTTPWDTTGLVDGGSYDVRAITTDNAGNTFTSPTVAVTVDRTGPSAPSTPVLTTPSDSGTTGDNVTNDTTPTYSGTAEPGSTVRLHDGLIQVGSATATGGSWTITASALSAGVHTITATAADPAGNVSAPSNSVALSIDTTAPAILATDLQIAPIDNTTTGGFLRQGGQYHVYANASDGGSGVAAVTANVTNVTAGQTAVPLVAGTYTVGGVSYGWRSATLTATNPLSAGNRNYTGTATDVAGNALTTGTRSVAIENTAPTGVVTAPSNGWATASTTITSSSADASAGVFTARFQWSPAGAGSWTTIETDPSSPYSVVWSTASLTDGASYDLRVITTDNASNTFTSPSVTVVLDLTPPSAPSTPMLDPVSDGGPDGDNLTNDSTPTFTGTAETGTTVVLFDGATPVGSVTAAGGTWSITTTTLASESHNITATATDPAGNVSAASGSVGLTIDTTIPTVIAAVLANGNVAARIDTGDTGVISFSEQMDATTFCSSWTNVGIQSLTDATITITDSGGSDTLSVTSPSCSFGLGTWMVGDYVGGGPATFVGSAVSWDPTARTITVTIGTLNTFTTIRTGVAQKANELTGSAPRADLAGNGISTATFIHPIASGF